MTGSSCSDRPYTVAYNGAALTYALNVTEWRIRSTCILAVDDVCCVYADLVPVSSSLKMINPSPSAESTEPLNANNVVSYVVDMNIGSTTCKSSPSFSNFTNSYNTLAPVVAFFSYFYLVYQFDNVTQQLS